MKPKIAVIWFPGCNCEEETRRVCDAAGLDASIIRWNETSELSGYDGFVLPGGWSYEDRVRAGVISSKDPIMELLKAEAVKGKPILGICNGCQVLVESGLVPDVKGGNELALAPNINPFVSGYYCSWIKIKNTGKQNAFNLLYEENEIIDIPIAHGEGRFVTSDDSLVNQLEQNGQIVFKYSDKAGNIDDNFPINPNGSTANIAGICNKEGNVLAMMPHPERAFYKKQLPEKQMSSYEDALSFASAAKIFQSMKKYIEEKKSS